MDELKARVAGYADSPPPGIAPTLWVDMVTAGAVAIADAQLAPNDGTPEEYATAALRAAEAVRVVTLAGVMTWIGREYRQCVAAARTTHNDDYYAMCNGRAEAYRQAAQELSRVTGVPCPDWDRIRTEVPRDGIIR